MKYKLFIAVLFFIILLTISSNSVFASSYYTVYGPWNTVNSSIQKEQIGDEVLSFYDRNNDGTLDYLHQKIFKNINIKVQARNVMTVNSENHQVVSQYTEYQNSYEQLPNSYEQYWIDGFYTTNKYELIEQEFINSYKEIVEVRDINGNGIPDEHIIVRNYKHQLIKMVTDIFKVENNKSSHYQTNYQYRDNQILASTDDYWIIY